MASPISPMLLNGALPGALNFASPLTSRKSETETDGIQSNALPAEDSDTSSPFISAIQDSKVESLAKENVSPTKSRHSRILSGNEIAPLKILGPRDENIDPESRSPARQMSSPMGKSPRKPFAPEKRFPVKVNSESPERPTEQSPMKSPTRPPQETTIKSPEKDVVAQHEITLEDAMRENKDLEQAIKIFEDEETILDKGEEEADMSVDLPMVDAEDEAAGPDTSMVSTFSTFSAVPNMTMFARIGHSPTRFANMGKTTPRGRPDPSPSRTSRPPVIHDSGNTTSLMDFTDQLSSFNARHNQQSPSRRPHFSPAKTTGRMPNSTPQRQQANLLDFDIPPLPTPRSIPTITPRELESLKSTFLSEISSLKASLLGKEAEVSSLKTAVGDAEKRVGECMEQLRETQCIKEALADEKESWAKRGREMEAVLRQVRNEIVHGQREKEELDSKLDESEKRREAAEIMAQEAESKMAGMRAGKVTENAAKSPDKGTKSPGSREVEIAVERVARELHALYKGKHEAKVTALKKSYETRWEKRVRQLEYRIEDLTDENEKLKLGRDAIINQVEPGQAAANEERKAQAVKNSAQITELNAEIQKLEASINSVKQDNQELIQLLEKERIEKGELVQLAEEMMSMQHSYIQPEEKPTPLATTPATRKSEAPQHPFRSSIGRPGVSGLRAPGTLPRSHTESRIGGKSHDRQKNGGSQGGLPQPGSGLSMRSGIMSSIEKMGSYRGRAE